MNTLKARFLYFVYPKNIDRIRNIRKRLLEELQKIVDNCIKDIDAHYEENRILRNSGIKEEEVVKKTSNSRIIPESFKQEIDNLLNITHINHDHK